MLFDEEGCEKIRKIRHLKKMKRKHYSTSELNSMHQDKKSILMENGESYEKKFSEQCNAEKSYELNKSLSEDVHSEIFSSGNILLQKKKKKKKQKEKTKESFHVVTKQCINNEVLNDDLQTVLDDCCGPTSSLEKDKNNTSNVEKEYSNAEGENMNEYVYKKKKKKNKKANSALDQSVTDYIKTDVYDEYIKKSKKKKNNKVQLAQEKVVPIPQEMKKSEVSAMDKVGTELSLIYLENQTENDISKKKSKKHKNRDKVSAIKYDSLPIKLKKRKHKENVVMAEDTQLSFFVDNIPSKAVKMTETDKHNELVEVVEPRKSIKRKQAVVTEEMPSHECEKGSIFKKKKKKYLQPIEDKVNDTNSTMMYDLIVGSPESNLSQHINKSRDDSAVSESVSEDTFTFEVHEADSYDALDDTISSNSVAEERSHTNKQCDTDKNRHNGLDTTITHNECQKSIKSEVNQQSVVNDISAKTEPLKEKPLSYKAIADQVRDKSHPEESYDFSGMHVTVPWPVPPLHQIETRVSGLPTKEQKIKLKALGKEIKLGIYSRSEDDQIKKNWRQFCQVHDMRNEDPTPFLSFTQPDRSRILPTTERINFVRFLAHGLHNRLLNSVYKRFQRLFLTKKIVTGRFSKKEDKIIKKYMKFTSSQTPYADLAKILNRDRLAVEKRCKVLMSRDNCMKWTEENIEIFLKHILKITESNSLDDLKNREIKPEEWKMLSKKLGICTTELRRAWSFSIYPKLFVSHGTLGNTLRVSLIEKLIENNENDWRAVDWQRIAADFDGFTAQKLNKLMKNVVYYHVPEDMHENLGECLKYLKDQISQKTTFSKRKLKTFELNKAYRLHKDAI